MKSIKFGKLIFHVIIVWSATFLGGFAVGFIRGAAGHELNSTAVAILYITIHFVSIFFITKIDKITWIHFAAMMVLLLITSLINVYFGQPVLNILFGVAFMVITGAIAKFSADFLGKKGEA